jgi:glycosyltransferase involved in cell wall biosynthesis
MRILAWPAFDNETGNPYNRLLYTSMAGMGVTVDEFLPRRALRSALRAEHDVWHLHWPDDLLSITPRRAAAWRVAGLLGLMTLARWRGICMVWTAHDLGPHESPHPRLERFFWRYFVPRVDAVVSLSAHGLEAARDRFPRLRGRPGFAIPHGHYRDAYRPAPPKKEARRELNLPPGAPVVLFVGRIRPYKNVERLVEAFQKMDAPKRAHLVVAGNPADEALRRRIKAAAEGAERVRLALRFIPEARLPAYLAVADLVALPYRDILHSGSALLALSFDRPVLVPGRGAMRELQEQVGPRWVRTFGSAGEEGNSLTPGTLREALRWARRRDRPARAPLGAFDWEKIAAQTVEVYRTVARDTNNPAGAE